MAPWLVVAGIAAVWTLALSGASPTFYDDDPIAREPETEDASKAGGREIDLMWDLSLNLFSRPGDAANGRAGNVNTIDEVPDSSWFTNRILARPVSLEEITVGPLVGSGPAPGPWHVVREKSAGDAPGFRMRDSAGTVWFVSLDARGHSEAATSAIVVANKLFWALGYWQVENFLTRISPDQILIDESATIRPASGIRRKFRRSDLDDVLRRADRSADGSYRAVAARALPGRPIDGFFYYGTRSDDPNDIVPHEHRRELRALKVFGAWTNLVDMKAGNTLDTVVTENGRGRVRHYFQDVGSTFGAGANGPHDYFEGFEYIVEGRSLFKRLYTLGFYRQPWQTAPYVEAPSIGRFESQAFDPRTWKPRVPTAAYLHARPDDDFWAARRVMAFSDQMIRAAVGTGEYSDAAAAEHLATMLIRRRDAVGRAFLPAVNPIVEPRLERGRLTFRNAAVDAGVADRPRGYVARWSRFDNHTGSATPIGATESTETTIEAPPLPASSFVKVEIAAMGATAKAWETAIVAYFRTRSGAWTLVGLERLPAGL